ncbi:MAG: hypothetical protein IJP22_01460 [Clostridia bacterium]|nr:hypothetical protein [Clostridia bacterium]
MKNFKNYSIDFREKEFAVFVGENEWFRLPVSSCVDTKEKTDIDIDSINLQLAETESSITAIWQTRSNLWHEKVYKIYADENGFHYTFNIKGEHKVFKIRYFTSKTNPSHHDVSGYLLPIATHKSRNNLTKNVFENGEIALGYFAPPPFVYPFYMARETGWFGLGLTAKAGQYNFDRFLYNNDFTFELPLYNRTEVNGEWEAPGIWGGYGEDALDVIAAYSNWHYDTGLCKRNTHENEPSWWRGPIFCGWGEQQALASANTVAIAGDNAQVVTSKVAPASLATQENYTKMMEKLEKEGLHPKFIIIDAHWQETDGNFVVNKKKWPDMRAFIDEQHKKGIRVLLWLRSWSAEGLPHDECVKSLTNPIASDPTNPKFIERVKKNLHTLLSSDEGCMNCDGFKVDFINCIPEGNNIATYKKGIYGVEFIKEWLDLLYNTTKQIKPDALLNVSCAHPYLAEVADQIRLHDIHGETCDSCAIMDYRADIVKAVYPSVTIDTDSGGVFSHRDFKRYMKYQAKIGVPDLYYLSSFCDVPMDDEDYNIIRKEWEEYSKTFS